MLSTWWALTTGKHFVSYSLLLYQLLEDIGSLGIDRTKSVETIMDLFWESV